MLPQTPCRHQESVCSSVSDQSLEKSECLLAFLLDLEPVPTVLVPEEHALEQEHHGTVRHHRNNCLPDDAIGLVDDRSHRGAFLGSGSHNRLGSNDLVLVRGGLVHDNDHRQS